MPTTTEGKAISARNSLKHGLRARAIVLPDESQDDWESFEHAYLEDLAPVGIAEETLALRAAELLWRMRRVATAERDAVLDRRQRPDEYSMDVWSNHSKFRLPNETPDILPESLPAPAALRPIMRYEAHLSRQFFQVTRELQQMQDRRNGARTTQITRVEIHGYPNQRTQPQLEPQSDVAQPPPAVNSPIKNGASVSATADGAQAPAPAPSPSPQPAPTADPHQYSRSFSSAESPSESESQLLDESQGDGPTPNPIKVPNELPSPPEQTLSPARERVVRRGGPGEGQERTKAITALMNRLLDPTRYEDPPDVEDWLLDPAAEAEDEALEDAMRGYTMPRFKES